MAKAPEIKGFRLRQITDFGSVIFTTYQTRELVFSTPGSALAMSASMMLFSLFIASVPFLTTDRFGKFLACIFAPVLFCVACNLALGVIRYRKNVFATEAGIGFGETFFHWDEVSKIKMHLKGRIDVVASRGASQTKFSFGMSYSYSEQAQGFQKAVTELKDARQAYIESKKDFNHRDK